VKPDTRSFYAQAVQRGIDFIVAHLDEGLDLSALARRACLSPFHFHRVFRGMVGETPMEMVRRLRMERAAWKLITTESAVTEIAFDAGYEAHEAFTRAFRSYYDAAPSGFRSRKYPRIEIAAPCGVHFRADPAVRRFTPRDSGGQHMEVEIKTMPELRVGAVSHVGPYNQIPLAFEKLGEIAGPAGLLQQPSPAIVALYYDDPESVPLDQLRSEAAIIVPAGRNVPEGLTERCLAAGRYACATHIGPYERLGDAWARFMGEWLPASGYRVGSGPSFEIYRNDPATTPKDELRTEMCIPLA
jgi:AraC family transcriptional regulator